MKILIVEDEIHIARHLEKLVLNILGEDVVDTKLALSVQEAFDYLNKWEIDVLLLDLNLGGKDGFEVLKILSAGSFHTIIVSAHKERAIEAFDYGVIDFLAKPFTELRLKKAFSRINEVNNRPEFPTKYYSIHKRGRIKLVKDENVIYFQAFGHYSKIHLKGGKLVLHDKSLVKLLPLLSNEYERVHKSYIVKMSEISDILVFEGGKYKLELKNGDVIPLGRSRYLLIKNKWLQ